MAKVYIVGAGPGDKGLISVKGMDAIKKADAIVYDRLVDENILLYAKDGCQMIYVGKQPHKHTMKQEEINQVLVELGQKNMDVVRLKGGDPYVFGRGSEEIEALVDAGVDFELVPGVTSAIGGLAYAGIPVTSRNMSSAFHVITGNGKNSTDVDVDWELLARAKGTLIFLMGVANISTIVDRLVSNGKAPNTPAAFVSWATWYDQKTYVTDLRSAVETVEKEAIKAPSIFVVGDVVNLREKLSYIEDRPLHSKTIALTRDTRQALKWLPKIEERGGRTLILPSIKIEPSHVDLYPDAEKPIFAGYDCLTFTSPNGVKYFMQAMKDSYLDIRSLASIKIACLGHGTLDELVSYGVQPDILTFESNGGSLSEAIAGYYEHMLLTGETRRTAKKIKKVILAGSNLSGENLKEGLKKHRIKLDLLEVYTNKPNVDQYPIIKDKIGSTRIDYMVFASPSSFYSISDLVKEDKDDSLGQRLSDIKSVAIGKTTARAMLDMGYEPTIVSDEPSIDRILDLIEEDINKEDK